MAHSILLVSEYLNHVYDSQIMAVRKFTTSPYQSPVASKAEIINFVIDNIGEVVKDDQKSYV